MTFPHKPSEPMPESLRRFEALQAEVEDRRAQVLALPLDDPHLPKLQEALSAVELRRDEAMPCANLILALGWSFHDAFKDRHMIDWQTQVVQVPFVVGAGYGAPGFLDETTREINVDRVLTFECYRGTDGDDAGMHIHALFSASENKIVYSIVPAGTSNPEAN